MKKLKTIDSVLKSVQMMFLFAIEIYLLSKEGMDSPVAPIIIFALVTQALGAIVEVIITIKSKKNSILHKSL